MKAALTIIVLAAGLIAALYYAFYMMTAFNLPMPSGHMLVAFLLGAAGCLIVSAGLFGLLFWSARNGRDDIDIHKP